MSSFDDLSPQQLEKLRRIKATPLSFMSNLVINFETGEKFVPYYPQVRIFTADAMQNWICIHRRGGKCLMGDSRVLNEKTLRPQPLATAHNVLQTPCFDFQHNTLVWAPAHWINSGRKQCVRLQFGTGISLGLSTDHLLFVADKGWIQAAEIRVGDRVLAPTEIPVFGEEQADDQLCAELVMHTIDVRYIPDLVFKLNPESLLCYVRSLWRATGRMLSAHGSLAILVYDKNVSLDLHHLLLRFGVESRITEDSNISVDDPIDQSTFLRLMGVDYPQYEVRASRRWEIVIGTKRIGEQDVYDMQVAHPDHNFLATDVIAHNSHALSLLALYYAVTQENKRIIVFTPSQPQLEEFFMKKINGWIRTNPIFSEMIDDTETQRDSPYPIRSFITGSTIQGFILGTKEGAQEGKRGLTADILILDEAQEYSKGDWAVVGAIMGGDTHRRKNKGVKTFIAGTIRQPDGYFFQKIKKLDIDPKNESRIFIPIDQNLDETPESVAHLKSITPPDIWNNEWMLELGDEEDTIFPKDDVMAGGFQDWEYGPKMIDYSPITRMPGEHVRFIGVDWDRVGAGTNIAVVQYDPFMRQMFTIDRIEVPRGQFTYYDACERMFDLYETYKPMLIVSDAGAGDMQWQYMWMEAGKKGMYEMQNRLIKLALNSKIDIPNPTTEEVDHVYIKPVLVGMLQKKLQERKWFYPAHDEDLKLQLLTYKKLRETVNTIKFSSNNEHIIDCHLFAVWGIWEMFESPFRDTSETQLAVRKLGVDKLSFRDDEQAMADFWDGLAGRQPVMGQRSNLWSEHPWGGSGGDQQGFNRPLSENFGRRNSLDRWLMD